MKNPRFLHIFVPFILPKTNGRIISLGLFGVILFIGAGFAALGDGPTVDFAPYLPFDAETSCTGGGRTAYIDWYPTVSCGGYAVKGIGVIAAVSGVFGSVADKIEYSSAGTGMCWCKMLSPAVSKWVSIDVQGTLTTCAGICSAYFVTNTDNLRQIILSNLVDY